MKDGQPRLSTVARSTAGDTVDRMLWTVSSRSTRSTVTRLRASGRRGHAGPGLAPGHVPPPTSSPLHTPSLLDPGCSSVSSPSRSALAALVVVGYCSARGQAAHEPHMTRSSRVTGGGVSADLHMGGRAGRQIHRMERAWEDACGMGGRRVGWI